jgi:DNA modification methylase
MRVEQIGDATLMLGDCLEIMPTLGDGTVDMIWSDPPYGHSNHDGDMNSRLNDARGIKCKPTVASTMHPDSFRAVTE